MKRLLVLVAAVLAAAAFAGSAGAIYGGPQLAASQCGGSLVLNVNHAVVNDADSGLSGYWAFDYYLRQIRVWQTAPGTYCAIVTYEGVFQTFPGALSPENGLPFTRRVVGIFSGGYRATITGTFSPGTNRTRGFLGVKDYQCDTSGNCANPFKWVDTYFAPSAGFAYQWWGWEYKAPRHGTWVNASDGNSGDITR